jgi:hypothetical protein
MKMLDYIALELEPLATDKLVVLNETIKLNDEWAKPIVSLILSIVSKRYKLSLEDINKIIRQKNSVTVKNIFTRVFNGIRNPFTFKLLASARNETEELNGKLNKLIEKCAKLSNMIKYIAVALFNDELDAHLEEAINNEINSQLINQKRKTHELELKEIRSKYKNYKINSNRIKYT